MTVQVISPKNGLPYLTYEPDVPNVSLEWQETMARLLATMEDDDQDDHFNTTTPNPPFSQVRQRRPEGGAHGERRSLLQGRTETATSTEKAS